MAGKAGGKPRFQIRRQERIGKSKSDEGRDESGGKVDGEVQHFEVGPPIGAKPMMGKQTWTWKHLGQKEGSQPR